jgi:hypothetical protein
MILCLHINRDKTGGMCGPQKKHAHSTARALRVQSVSSLLTLVNSCMNHLQPSQQAFAWDHMRESPVTAAPSCQARVYHFRKSAEEGWF